MTHHLKTWPEFFAKVKTGEKTFEIRKDDGRNFAVGDTLVLEEFEPCEKCRGKGHPIHFGRGPAADCINCNGVGGEFTGESLIFTVPYLTSLGQRHGQIVMAIKPLEDWQ